MSEQIMTPPAVTPAAAPKNGLGTAGLVLGVLAVVFSFIPVFGMFVAIPLGVLAILFGLLGWLVRVRHGRATNKGVSIAGFVLGVVAFALSIIMSVAVYNAVDDAVTELNSGTGAASTDTDGGKAVVAHEKTARIGQPVRDGKFQFVVEKVTYRKHVGGMFGDTAKGRYAIVRLRVRNIGNEAQTLDDSSQYLYDARGRKFSADGAADIDLGGVGGHSSTWFEDINPGTGVYGRIAFDMPRNTRPVTIELHDSMFSGGVVVNLK